MNLLYYEFLKPNSKPVNEKHVFRSTLLLLISKRFFILLISMQPPNIGPPVYKLIQKPFRSCICPGFEAEFYVLTEK